MPTTRGSNPWANSPVFKKRGEAGARDVESFKQLAKDDAVRVNQPTSYREMQKVMLDLGLGALTPDNVASTMSDMYADAADMVADSLKRQLDSIREGSKSNALGGYVPVVLETKPQKYQLGKGAPQGDQRVIFSVKEYAVRVISPFEPTKKMPNLFEILDKGRDPLPAGKKKYPMHNLVPIEEKVNGKKRISTNTARIKAENDKRQIRSPITGRYTLAGTSKPNKIDPITRTRGTNMAGWRIERAPTVFTTSVRGTVALNLYNRALKNARKRVKGSFPKGFFEVIRLGDQ
jgi:hypothetical protein